MSDDLYREILEAVTRHNDLTFEQAHAVFTLLMDGQLGEVRIAGLLMAMATKGPSVPEIAGAAQAMREHAVTIDTAGHSVVDIVGTGGTGLQTFNISTTSCFVAAGAGLHVAKHGNVTNTRASGSANILQALGVNIEVDPSAVSRCIDEAGVGFCYARACHPAMKFAAPVRKQLPVGTVFNILGPLTNPAGATHMVLGVFADYLTEVLAGVLGKLGCRRAWVVHSEDGLDELSCAAPTRVSELAGGEVRTFSVTPENAGLTSGTLADILIDSPEASAEMCKAVLNGEVGAGRDIACLNAGAALVVAGKADDLAAGVNLAAESIDSGRAREAVEQLVAITNG
ncbi:MAG: anthranilate phosphoribosyltransferase [Planctomycetes bacterium]|jgi:anthranilate phosphoribosyltransferase|nr:anthranilate phosphoribosyltransferase [Planctomycetota bacterium]